MNSGLYVLLENLQHFITTRSQYTTRRDPDLDDLLASVQKALIYIGENEINTIAKPLLSLDLGEVWKGRFSYDRTLIQTFANTISVLSSKYEHILRSPHPAPHVDASSQLAHAHRVHIAVIYNIIFSYLSVNGFQHLYPEHISNRKSPMPPLPRNEIEQCIHATISVRWYFLLPFTLRVRHRIFKTVGEEGNLRYCSVVQKQGFIEGDLVYSDALYFSKTDP